MIKKTKIKFALGVLVLGVSFISFQFIYAKIPSNINYQGKLKDSAGEPITVATTIQFSLYNHSTNGASTDVPGAGGPLLWTETYDGSGSCAQITPGVDGIFAQNLGDCISFPDYLDFTEEYYLGVKIGGDAEATPRVSLSTNPYSFTSKKLFTDGENISITTATSGDIILNAIDDILMDSDGEIQITGNNAFFPGAVYNADYSANYTNRSIVDKEYVDDQLMWEIVNGGERIQPKNNSVRQIFVREDSNSYTQFRVENHNDAGNGAGAIIELKGSGAEYTNNMYIGKYGASFWIPELQDNGAVLTDKNLVIGTASDSHEIHFVTGDSYVDLKPVVVADNEGFRYTSDLSATYVDRTLVDKEYVDDAVVSGANNIYTADGTLTEERTISLDGNNLLFKGEGNLGIGETSPKERLVVAGNLHTLQTEAPKLVGVLSGGFEPNDVHVVNDYAYMATSKSLVIASVADKTHPTLISESSDGLTQPRALYVSGEYAYILDSRKATDAMVVYDISNPTKPVYIGEVGDEINGPVDIYVSGNRAFITSSVDASLVVVDISNPVNPFISGRIDGAIKNPTALYVSGEYAYVLNTNDGEIGIFDVNADINPQLLNKIADVKNPVDIYASGRYIYVVDGDNHTLNAIDVSNPGNISHIGSVELKFEDTLDLWISGNYAYITGNKGGVVSIYDITDPTNMEFVNSVEGFGNLPSEIFVNSKYAYVVSSKDRQMYIFELNHTETPNLVTGSVLASDLQIEDNAQFDNDVYVWGGVGIGNDLNIQHNIAADGMGLFANESGKASVGIGTLHPGAKLQVGEKGDGTVAIANNWTTFSDKRYKKNIETLEGALDKVMQLDGVEYEWKVNDEKTIGFIAQDVKDVLPEIVFEDEGGYYSIDYSKVTPVLVNAIKEQQEQIDELKQGGGDRENVNKDADKIIAGRDIIKSGENELRVEFDEKFAFVPYVTAVNNSTFDSFLIEDISEDGFTIRIQEEAKDDIKFTWHVTVASFNEG